MYVETTRHFAEILRILAKVEVDAPFLFNLAMLLAKPGMNNPLQRFYKIFDS